MSHLKLTLTPPIKNSYRGVENRCLFNKPSMIGAASGNKKMERNLWPQAQSESIAWHCFARTKETLWRTKLLFCFLWRFWPSTDATWAQIQINRPRRFSPSQTPNSDAQWLKEKVRWRFISPHRVQLRETPKPGRESQLVQTKHGWPESSVSVKNRNSV